MEIETEGPQRNRKVSIPDRWDIVNLRKEGHTYSKIGESVGRSASTCRDIYQRWKETGNVEDRNRSGRPSEVTEEEKEKFISTVRDHPNMTLNQLLDESKVSFSKTYAWDLLHECGFKSKAQSAKWRLDEEHKRARLAWAKQYIKKPAKFWTQVIFTDETIAQHRSIQGRYWLEGKEKPPPTESDRWDVSRLVWGSIAYDGTCLIEVIDGTMDSKVYLDLLQRRLLRNYKGLGLNREGINGSNKLIFQHDGAKPHMAFKIYDYFDRKSIEVLPWPARSPDLNPIEEVWAWLKNKMKSSYQSGEELEEDVLNIWQELQTDHIKNLYRSMGERIQAVIDAEGGPTDY